MLKRGGKNATNVLNDGEFWAYFLNYIYVAQEHISAFVLKSTPFACRAERLAGRATGNQINLISSSQASHFHYFGSRVIPYVTYQPDFRPVGGYRLAATSINLTGKKRMNPSFF